MVLSGSRTLWQNGFTDFRPSANNIRVVRMILKIRTYRPKNNIILIEGYGGSFKREGAMASPSGWIFVLEHSKNSSGQKKKTSSTN